MKKTYIMPNCKYAELDNTVSLLADSLIGNEGQLGTGTTDEQESRTEITDINLWDKEW